MVEIGLLQGLLFDLDGVFHVGNSKVAGSEDVIAYLNSKHLPYRYVTNTTIQSRVALAANMQALGLPIQADEIITTPYAARLYLRQHNYQSCYLLLADEVISEFAEFDADDIAPQAVVIGDIGSLWNYDLLNKVFRLLMDGAHLLALHKNKFWQTETGLRMDIGAFVAGLEYASGQTATVIGKPSPAFFALALQSLGLEADQVGMVGDDIDCDIGGAQQCGLRGILVRTGKFRADYAAASTIRPDVVIDSVADLTRYFER